MHITLKQMQVFQAVAIHQQVNLAAKSLFITQPAASMALRELEKQLGVSLFDRLGNRLVINSNGRHLLPYVRELLHRAQEIENIFSSNNHDITGSLLIGSSLTIGNHILPSVLSRMQDDLPGITPQVSIRNSRELVELLLECKLDVALVEGKCQHQDLIAMPWCYDHMLIVAQADHPLARDRNLSLKKLMGETWILREKGSGSRDIFDDMIAAELSNRYRVFEMQNTEAIVNSVIEGLGITCISNLSVRHQIHNKELVSLPINGLSLKRPMHLVVHRDRHQNNTLKAFVDLCLDPDKKKIQLAAV